MSPSLLKTISFALLTLCTRFATANDDKAIANFESRVRPLLAKHCYSCHSGTAKKIEANLRLDHRSLMVQGGDSGPAIQTNKSSASLLMQAVRYETFEMPPSGKLAAEEIETLRDWIDAGAVWPEEPVPSVNEAKEVFDLKKRRMEHWAWQPRLDPTPPKLNEDSWSDTPIDRFVLQSIRSHSLEPNTQADRSTLIRRVYLDLLGIPPTIEQLEYHLRDNDSDWYEVLVEQLLASPQFGVRFGRHWLDLVRYAESRGHEFDEDVLGANHYRDYVVRAINQDLPYNQFITEQIAGDLLKEPRIHPRGWNESLIATGFWHLGEWVHSPVDSRKDETDRFDNMIDVFSKSMQGLTVACARCHDHKFDAIGTADYYALSGFLKSSHYRMVRFETDFEHRGIEQQRQQLRATWNRKLSDWPLHALRTLVANPASKEKLFSQILEGDTQRGQSPSWKVATRIPADDPRLRVDYSRSPSKGNWIAEGPGFGTGPVSEDSFDFDREGKSPVRWHAYGAAHFDRYWSELKSSVDSINLKNGYSQVDTSGRTLITSTFEMKSGELSYLIRGECQAFAAVDSMRLLAGPLHGETRREFKDKGSSGTYRWVTHSLQRYQGKRLNVEFAPIEGQPFEVVQVIDGPPPESPAAKPTKESLQTLLESGLSRIEKNGTPLSDDSATDQVRVVLGEAIETLLMQTNAFVGDASNEWESGIKAWQDSLNLLASKTTWQSQVAMAMIDGSGENHPILIRGSHEHDGPIVDRRFLEALHGSKIESPGSGRLQLAREMIDLRNPLTARVIVNRIWHHLLGKGIVATTDDFGVQGQKPTHPELLDFLASRLIDHDWSVKQTVRSILLSKTYRLSSIVSKQANEVDPDNQWLARARVRRLEAEAVRDTLMSIANRLDKRLEGKSVPVHLTEFLEGRGRPGKSGPADGESRRSLFITVRRNFLVPMMTTFDAPNPFSSMGRRNVSSVPAQSLMLLNDPFVHQLAKQWSELVLANTSLSDSERIDSMYLAAFSRRPTTDEQRIALAFLDETMQSSSRSEAWQNFAHVLMNMKELILRF